MIQPKSETLELYMDNKDDDQHMPPNISLSLIVPVYNGGDNFRLCLAALQRLDPAPDEIIVVVDGATDDSAEIAATYGAQVIRRSVCGGSAQARNAGARAARGEILFFVDADVVVHPDAVAQVLAAFAETPDLAAVFGSYDATPAAPGFISQYRNLLHHYVHQTSHEEASTFWSGCGAIRRTVFEMVGGYNEHYERPAIEDIALGYRLKQAGYRIRLRKTLLATHLKLWDAATMVKTDFLYRALPWTDLILREGRFINDLNLRLSSRASVVLVYLFLVVCGLGWLWPALWSVAGLSVLGLLALNIDFYRFLAQQRGLGFALRAIPWHWLYFGYSGLAFAVGVLRYLWRRRPGARPVDTAAASLPETS